MEYIGVFHTIIRINSDCCILSFGWFPGVWILYADVSEPPVSYIFTGDVSRKNNRVILPAYTAFEDGTDGVPKRRHIKFRHRVITQKKEYNIQNRPKVWNQENSDYIIKRHL